MSLKLTFKAIFYAQKFSYKIKKTSQRGLSYICGYIRTSARRNIRISKRASAPGSPVHSRGRGGLRLIEYAVYSNGGVIGPVKFAGSNFFNQPIPFIHEFGGTFISLKGYFSYPKRSYMSYTLNQLQAKGVLLKQFSYQMGTIW